MVVLYLFARLFLASLHFLVRWRVTRLEKRFVRTAAEADALVKASRLRGGNNHTDPYAYAKQQFELASLAMKRDSIESRYTAWQTRSERLAALRKSMAGYRGQLLPYFVGAVDVSSLVLLLHWLEVSVPEVRSLVGM